MSRLTTVYASAYAPESPKYVTLEKGEKVTYSVNWNGVLNSFTTPATISSQTWTQDSGANITISGEAESAGVASALFTATNIGRTVITNQATLSNGEVREQKFAVQVIDSRYY